MVGPLYMGEGNLVTEAGGIVFRDASAANYGRSFALHHEYLYARKVDYISAACVLIPKSAWLLVGGFDLRYEKGYYEDTDMAMAFRREGLEVYFQPGSIVYHQEGHTFGSDSPLKLRLMAANKGKFVDKWRSQLERDHSFVSGDFQAASIQRYNETLLWFVQQVLVSEDGPGSRRSRKIAQRMMSKGSVHLTMQPLEGIKLLESHSRDTLEARIVGIDVLDPDSSDVTSDGGSLPAFKSIANGACDYHMLMVSGLDLLARVNRSLVESCPSIPVILDLASSDSSPLLPSHLIDEQGDVVKTLVNRKITVGGKRSLDDLKPQALVGKIVAWIESKMDSKEGVMKGLTYHQGLAFIKQASSVMVSSDIEKQVLVRLLPHFDHASIHVVTA